MRRLFVLALVAVFSCQSATLEQGDAQFRMANYHAALQIYSQLPADPQDSTVSLRIERTRYFLLEQGVRELLHLDRPEDAAAVLDFLISNAPTDRVDALELLRQRTRTQIAQRHYGLGYDYSEANQPAAASEELRFALSWNPQHVEAQELLVRTDQWLDTHERIGEDYYFQGMDQLRAHHDLRARTAFMHASDLLGEDSLADSRLRHLTLELAEESRALGRMFLEAGLTGPAWAAILDSIHLDPVNPEALQLAARIEAQVQSTATLTSVDVAVRGGATEAADGLLERARGYGVVQHARRLAELSQKNQERKNQDRYRRARAYELDTRMVHARDLYRAILSDEGGFPWEDVEVRVAAIEQRLLQAEAAYRRALRAEQAGDPAAYAAALIEAVHLAVDYADVRTRFLALPTMEEEGDGGDEGT